MRLIPFSFLKDIIFYSGGSFIGRIVTLFLLPLTTSYLTPSDYGVIGMLTLATTLLSGLFTLGFHTSLGRVYSGSKEILEKEGIICSAFFVLLITNVILTTAAIAFSNEISVLLMGSKAFAGLIPITFIGLGLSSVRMSFEYYLRASGKSKTVFALNMADVALSISIMLLEIIYLKRGAYGYMEASAISQGLNLALMLGLVAAGLHISIQWKSIVELIKIGAPCIFGYLSFCLLQGVSRYILQLESTEEQVGFYFLGTNVGKVIELPLWGFMSAWVPLFNSYIDRQREAPVVFSKVMTYYLIGMSLFIVPLFCLARPVVQLMMQPQFKQVWTVVGLSAASLALWGAYAVSYPPLIFHKRTILQSCMEVCAAGFCIILNILLVPMFHKEGAAAATFLGFLSLLLASIWVNGKLLHIPYEVSRIAKIAGGVGLAALLSFYPIENFRLYTLCMIVVLMAFYAYCWFYILREDERMQIRRKISFLPVSTS